jgi:hypothetical protein
MAPSQQVPRISLDELPDFEGPVALHGARMDSSPCLGVSDDLWIIAVIMVYEK